jgi:hypothetical protein
MHFLGHCLCSGLASVNPDPSGDMAAHFSFR